MYVYMYRQSIKLYNTLNIARYSLFHVSTETIIRQMITTSCYIDCQLTFVW